VGLGDTQEPSGDAKSDFEDDEHPLWGAGMTVSQLMSQLRKMPQHVEVGYAHGDNGEYEVAGWCERVFCFRKKECDRGLLYGKDERSMFESMPDTCVIVRG
jgi:hypothetical protein